jgi:putative FmdB family regulatory protein
VPIFEYQCRKCGNEFELLVLKDTVIACPSCQGQDLERLLSGFAVNSEELSRARVQKARKANAQSSNYKDKQIAEAEHIREHINEHNDEARNRQ